MMCSLLPRASTDAVKMRLCQRNVVWCRCFRGHDTHKNKCELTVGPQELIRQTNRDCIPVVPQTPADVAAIVCFWLNVHTCIHNGVSASSIFKCVFWDCVLKAAFHDCFPCLLTGFLWCREAERCCQPWGREATESVNKCPQARSSQVIRPHRHIYIRTHTTPHFQDDQ